jgi:hypothetical protein
MSERNKLVVACCRFRGTHGTAIYITREPVRTPRPARFAHIDQTKGPALTFCRLTGQPNPDVEVIEPLDAVEEWRASRSLNRRRCEVQLRNTDDNFPRDDPR